MRVVSLLPSATEILCGVGGRGMLVGRSHECDHPEGLGGVPALTRARTTGHDPRAIDGQVRAALAEGRSLYELDERALVALAPDLILTQDLCAVCSIDRRTVERVAASLTRPPAVLALNPGTIDEVLDDHLRVGAAVGLGELARDAVNVMKSRLLRAEEHVNPYDDGPALTFLEWTDPLFVAGHWTVQLIERAGARHPLHPTTPDPGSGAAAGPQRAQRRAGASFAVAPDALVACAPEALVVCPCGLDLGAAWSAVRSLADRPWWDDLPAVRRGRVAVVDGSAMFNRPGPRLVDAFEWLVGWLHHRPELIPRGFPWRGWAPG